MNDELQSNAINFFIDKETYIMLFKMMILPLGMRWKYYTW